MFNNTGTKLEETCLTVYVLHLVNTWADDRPIERKLSLALHEQHFLLSL